MFLHHGTLYTYAYNIKSFFSVFFFLIKRIPVPSRELSALPLLREHKLTSFFIEHANGHVTKGRAPSYLNIFPYCKGHKDLNCNFLHNCIFRLYK